MRFYDPPPGVTRYGCCKDKIVNERGWCRRCGVKIADPEPQDGGIAGVMRMNRERLAEIKTKWKPKEEKKRQLSLDLVEQDRAEEIDWGDADDAQDHEHRPYWRR